MSVDTSNTDMFTIDTAMGMLVNLYPKMKENERTAWRNKGSDAILAEIARVKESRKIKEPAVVEVKEEDNVVATSTVAKKSK